MVRSACLALLLAVAAPLAAYAQSGTPAQRRACNADAKRYCKVEIQYGEGAVYSCLQQNASKLSGRCRKVVMGG